MNKIIELNQKEIFVVAGGEGYGILLPFGFISAGFGIASFGLYLVMGSLSGNGFKSCGNDSINSFIITLSTLLRSVGTLTGLTACCLGALSTGIGLKMATNN